MHAGGRRPVEVAALAGRIDDAAAATGWGWSCGANGIAAVAGWRGGGLAGVGGGARADRGADAAVGVADGKHRLIGPEGANSHLKLERIGAAIAGLIGEGVVVLIDEAAAQVEDAVNLANELQVCGVEDAAVPLIIESCGILDLARPGGAENRIDRSRGRADYGIDQIFSK